MSDFYQAALDQFEFTQFMRRDFHRHPELGFNEFRTAGIVARELNALGLEVTTGVGKTGVVGLLEGSHPGPTILMRFDMDALPITEDTGAEYASENPGVMHACGHDAHTAIGLTVARLLNAEKENLGGKVKFIFQPAEEGLGGAEGMLADGILENPRPDYSLSLHVWNNKPLGWIGISKGYVMAAAEEFTVKIHGRGGHGAIPNLAVDPIVAAAQIINAVQTIVSRNVSPSETAVVSVTTVHGGDAFNVIPPQVELTGTIRTFKPEIRQTVIERFTQIINGIAASMNCTADIKLLASTPALFNDASVTEVVQNVAAQIPGVTLDTNFSTMGSEDMAFMMEKVPGCYFMVGSANYDTGKNAPHHHPRFDIDESVLPKAAGLMASAAAQILNNGI